MNSEKKNDSSVTVNVSNMPPASDEFTANTEKYISHKISLACVHNLLSAKRYSHWHRVGIGMIQKVYPMTRLSKNKNSTLTPDFLVHTAPRRGAEMLIFFLLISQ